MSKVNSFGKRIKYHHNIMMTQNQNERQPLKYGRRALFRVRSYESGCQCSHEICLIGLRSLPPNDSKRTHVQKLTTVQHNLEYFTLRNRSHVYQTTKAALSEKRYYRQTRSS